VNIQLAFNKINYVELNPSTPALRHSFVSILFHPMNTAVHGLTNSFDTLCNLVIATHEFSSGNHYSFVSLLSEVGKTREGVIPTHTKIPDRGKP